MPRRISYPTQPITGVLPLVGQGQSGDWPMYGYDLGRTNYNPNESTLSAGNIHQLVPLWQASVGYGTAPTSAGPVVANGRVFVGSSVPAGQNFFSFDALNGSMIWSADIGHGSACFGVGLGATAAVSGSVVVEGGGDGAYYGLNIDTGATLWRNLLNAGPSGFAWASPLLFAGKAYIGTSSGCDNPSVRGAIQSVDIQTGAVIASQYFVPEGEAGAGIWNSPSLSTDGKSLLVATGEDYGDYDGDYNRALVSLDPSSLDLKAVNKQGGTNHDLDFATSPIVFTDSDDDDLVAAHHKDEMFYVYKLDDIADGPIWQRHTGSIIGLMPAYDPGFEGGTLFFIDGDGIINAVEPQTGNARWPATKLGSARSNIAIANGLIFANLGEDGLVILDEQNGHKLATFKPDHAGKTYSGVVVANGIVYWLSGGYLNAWGLPSNTLAPGVATTTPRQ